MTEQTTPETVTEAPAAQLQISDILLAAQVMQLVSQRGAFKAEEMEQVGGLYNRLVAFLQASGAVQPAPETPADTAATEPVAPAAEASTPAA